MADCDCIVVYEPIEVHVRRLAATGGHADGADWYMSDNIIDWDWSPEVEEGNRAVLRCGGRIKNVMQDDDVLTGGTLKLTFCCEDAELQYVMGGSNGTITYDASSPPCATGYCYPTPDDQEDAYDYEVCVYLSVVDGSNVTGYKELHFYLCKPAFFSEGGGQEEYPTHEVSIKCVDNPQYSPVKGVLCWKKLTTIPTDPDHT